MWKHACHSNVYDIVPKETACDKTMRCKVTAYLQKREKKGCLSSKKEKRKKKKKKKKNYVYANEKVK